MGGHFVITKHHILPANQNLSSVYFSLAKFELGYVQPFFCHELANDIYSQTAKTVLSHLNKLTNIENTQEGNIWGV